MHSAILWDIAPCIPYVKRRLGRTYHFHLEGRKSAWARHLLHAGVFLGWFSTLKKEVIRSSETSVYKRTTRRSIPEDGNINIISVPHFISLMHKGCLIALYCGWLNPDQINSVEMEASSRPPSPGTESLPPTPPTPGPFGGSVNTYGGLGEGALALS
jgi:hypothetical protein